MGRPFALAERCDTTEPACRFIDNFTDFVRDMANSPGMVFCYLDHSLSPGIGAVSLKDGPDKDKESIGASF